MPARAPVGRVRPQVLHRVSCGAPSPLEAQGFLVLFFPKRRAIHLPPPKFSSIPRTPKTQTPSNTRTEISGMQVPLLPQCYTARQINHCCIAPSPFPQLRIFAPPPFAAAVSFLHFFYSFLYSLYSSPHS